MLRVEQAALLLITLLLSLGCDSKNSISRPGVSDDSIVIYCSGDTAGWITPCGCTSGQSGGLSRRASLIAAESGRAIYVDVGGAPAGSTEYHLKKFRAILQGEKAIGLVAHNLGAAELQFLPTNLHVIEQQHGVPFLSTNVSHALTPVGKPDWIQKSILIPTKLGTLQFLGVVSPDLVDNDAWKVSDPKQSVLAEIRATQADVRVLLAYSPESELVELARSIPELSFVIGGPTGQTLPPRRVGRAIVSSTTNKGKYLVKTLAFGTPESRLAGTAVLEVSSDISLNSVQDQNLAEFYELLAKRDFSATETGMLDSRIPAGAKEYQIAGSAACSKCHDADQHVWTGSHHNHAFESLAKTKAHFEPACQICHTTGYALPGGFERVATSSTRLGVGCESCHGPSLAHVNQPTKRTPFIAADQCRKCHDLENSPQFDYATYWPKILHGKK